MTDFDFVTFEKAFGVVLTAFRVRLPVPEREALTRTYFAVLAAHPIDDVMGAGKRCIEKLRVFPKAADWLAELTPRTMTATCPADRRTMRVDEADELARAAALGYEDEPCACFLCQSAGISHRPIRYVPTEFGPDDLEQAFNPRRGVVEIVGHWAHGEELARWYCARDAFFALAKRAPRTLFDAVAIIVGERVPGMEG